MGPSNDVTEAQAGRTVCATTQRVANLAKDDDMSKRGPEDEAGRCVCATTRNGSQTSKTEAASAFWVGNILTII